MDPDVKECLIKHAGSRMTEEGILIIEAKRYRTQETPQPASLGSMINPNSMFKSMDIAPFNPT
jgi:hypothetical protein